MAKPAKTTVLTFAALTAMAAADLFKLASENVKVSKAVDTAKDKFVDALKPFSKVVAAMKRLYTERVETRSITAVSFKKFWKDNAGGGVPGRAESLAGLFNTLVLTLDGNGRPLLPEEYYDDAKVAWLEQANAIVNAARKAYGDNWKGCDDVLDTINALSKPGDAAEKLAEIRKRQKGEKESDGADTSAVAITPALAAQYLIAAIKEAAQKTPEEQYVLCCHFYDVENAWAALPEALTSALDKKYAKALEAGVAPHLEIVRAETAELQAA